MLQRSNGMLRSCNLGCADLPLLLKCQVSILQLMLQLLLFGFSHINIALSGNNTLFCCVNTTLSIVGMLLYGVSNALCRIGTLLSSLNLRPHLV